MLTLYGFGPAFNLPDPSPFVTKIDLTLRVHGIEFKRIDSSNNLQKAPKTKLPFIEDHGVIVSDSVFIIDYLKDRYKVDLDAHLTQEQAAQAQLIGKSLDENLYWAIVHSRWIKDDVWPTVKANFFNPLPFPINHLVAWYARNSTRKQIIGHGIGKHSDQEIEKIAHKSWASLSTLLGGKSYFFGNKISSLDVTTFAMLGALTLSNLETQLGEHAKAYENLADHSRRIAKQYYPNEIAL